MLWVPKKNTMQRQHNLEATPNASPGGAITTGAANTKGLYSAGELIASTDFAVYAFQLYCMNTGSTNTRTDMLLDIGIGPSGSETTILSNLLCGWRAASVALSGTFFPLFIPKGTRIAARAQGAIVNDIVDVAIFLYGDGFWQSPVYSGCDAIGAVTASSQGTAHTPGNTGAESSWASLGSTLSRNYRAISFCVGGTTATTVTTLIAYHWELGYNSGAPIFGEWWTRSATNETVTNPYPSWPIKASLASGTQIQVRGEASGTAQSHDVAAYCFY